MSPAAWPAAVKGRALRLYPEHGSTVTAKILAEEGHPVAHGTVTTWAHEAGVSGPRSTAHWPERIREAERRYPSLLSSWRPALRADMDCAVQLITDMLKADVGHERRGSRPGLDLDAGLARYRELFGDTED